MIGGGPGSPLATAPPPGGGVHTDTSTLPPGVTGAADHAGSDLLSVKVPIGAGILTLALVGVWVGRYVRRRRTGRPAPTRRWLRTTGFATASFLMVGVTTALAVNVYAGYLPTATSAYRFLSGDHSATVTNDATTAQAVAASGEGTCAAGSDRGWQVHDTMYPADRALDVHRRQVIVATPPGYDSCKEDYPTLYVFSGAPGKANDWFETGHITSVIDALVARKLSPFYVIVAPDVNGGYFNDSETLDSPTGSKVETWVTHDVVDTVERTYHVRRDRGDRVLAGMSSGGFAAVNLLFRNQDEFGIALAMEPYGDPGNVTNRLLGGNVSLLHANSPAYYIPTLPLHRRLAVYMDVGTGTSEVKPLENLASFIGIRGEDVTFRPEQGQGHTWSEATAGLPYALTFAAQHLGAPELSLVYSPKAFPLTHRNRESLIVSQDEGVAREHHATCVKLRAQAKAAGTEPVLPAFCLPPVTKPGPATTRGAR